MPARRNKADAARPPEQRPAFPETLAEIEAVCAVPLDSFARRTRLAAEHAARTGRPPRALEGLPGVRECVEELARRGVTLDMPDLNDRGLVALAMRERGVDHPLVGFLRLLGASERGVANTLMTKAIIANDLHALRGAVAAATKDDLGDALGTAAFYDHLPVMALLAELGASVDGHRAVPIAQAAGRGKLAALRWLHARGADVNRAQTSPEFAVKALTWALMNRHEAAAELLRSWRATQ